MHAQPRSRWPPVQVKISGVMVAGGVQDLDGPWFGTQVGLAGQAAAGWQRGRWAGGWAAMGLAE